MKKIAIIVLALVALSFGCNVGDTRWCHYVEKSKKRHTDIYDGYGGPEYEIRKLLNDPCEGLHVMSFGLYSSYDNPEETHYLIECAVNPQARVPLGTLLEVHENKLVIHLFDGIHLSNGPVDMEIDTGDVARRAFRRAENAASVIANKARYRWNP